MGYELCPFLINNVSEINRCIVKNLNVEKKVNVSEVLLFLCLVVY